jgi:DNA-binding HxlR family transcriptional regulator
MKTTGSKAGADPAHAAPEAHEGAQNRCSQAVLKLVADYWVLRIVEEISLAPDGARFSNLQRSLGGASPATLTNRLRTLADEQVITRSVDGGQSVVYRLTDRGRRLLPVLTSIRQFAVG